MKKMTALIAMVAAMGMAPRPATAQTVIICESVEGHRRTCPANTSAGVTLSRQLSSTPCVQGRNWDLNTANVIWVDGGCRAEFLVANSRGRYSNGRYSHDVYTSGVYNNDYNNTREVSSAETLCRRAVREQFGGRSVVSTWMINASHTRSRVGWRLTNGRAGECRQDASGNVSVLPANRSR
jgi:hypothetical protein